MQVVSEGKEMNINKFESMINKTILERGRSYYLEGNVVDSYEQRQNEYVFHIEGRDCYEIILEIGNEGEIVYSECDCPYDGPVCKHEVAAYFQLYEMLNQDTANEKKQNKKKRITINEVLTNLSKDELINIIINITNKDVTLKNSLLVKYSNGDSDQELRACKELINGIIRKYTAREGFIKYRDTSFFVRELDEKAVKALNTDNVLIALDIAFLLLDEAIGAFQYADDSGGDIGCLVTETLEIIEEIIDGREESAHQESQLFEKLLAKTDSEIFEDWIDYKIELLAICFAFAEDEAYRQQLIDRIESNINESTTDRYAHYGNESMLDLLFQLIEHYGTKDEVEQFIFQHLSFSSFREKLLNKYMLENNYDKVIKYAKEGEKQDQEYRGLLSKWKTFRYEAYKKLHLKEEQQALAKELFFDGYFEYYQDLKELAKSNFDEFYTNLKIELKAGKGWNHESFFLKIIEEENDIDEIMNFVRSNPRYVEDYAKILVVHFKEEVLEIYNNYIKAKASSASNRKEYQGICQKIKKYKEVAGATKQEEIINELMDIYKKRPAFIDELGRVR